MQCLTIIPLGYFLIFAAINKSLRKSYISFLRITEYAHRINAEEWNYILKAFGIYYQLPSKKMIKIKSINRKKKDKSAHFTISSTMPDAGYEYFVDMSDPSFIIIEFFPKALN